MNKLGLLGPKNTFHDIARKKFIPHFEATFFETFDEVFQALQNGVISKALVATSNSSSGLVSNNEQRISKSGFKVLDKFELPISLFLASKYPNTLASIKKIYSHPMAIKETQRYFSKYSNIKFIATSSTSGAIDEAKNNNEESAAVIASKEAIENNKLLIISEHIEDDPNNSTTFQLIEK